MSEEQGQGNLPILFEGELFNPQESFARLNPRTDLIEVIHISSGEVIALLGEVPDLKNAPVEFTEIITATGKTIFVQKGIPMDAHIDQKAWNYNNIFSDIICAHIASGMSLKKVSDLKGMPSLGVFYEWKRKYPEFETALNVAYADRADYLSDLAIEEAQKLNPKDCTTEEVSAVKAKADVYFKGAAHGNRDKFGNTTKVVGDAKNPVVFRIETGIRRPEDAEFFIDETKKLREIKDG